MFLASDYVSIVMTKNSPILNDINLKKKSTRSTLVDVLLYFDEENQKRDTVTIGEFLSFGQFLSFASYFGVPWQVRVTFSRHEELRHHWQVPSDRVFVQWKDIFMRLVAATGGGRDKCTKSRATNRWCALWRARVIRGVIDSQFQ